MTPSRKRKPANGAAATAKPGRAASKYVPWAGVPDVRRRTMSAIRSRDTKPELLVRRLLHAAGYRFVVGRRVEGYRPDVVFTKRRKAVFVHGCFWHGHGACGHDKVPKTRPEYWASKIEGNQQRDQRAAKALDQSGWEVLVLWECEIRSSDTARRLADFLGPARWAGSARAEP